MRKIVVSMIAFVLLSCSFNDDNEPLILQDAISFNLNGTDYFLTDYNVMLNPADSNERMIEATFDNNTKTLLFYVIVEETNQIEEFILIENGIEYSSDPIMGDRETSITTHTDSNMIGTFRAVLTDRNDLPIHTFTNGIIHIKF
ncbi:MAG: hypothetical protein AB8B65_07795 [Kordia sp.]|uniref:hypothetical protein n=1 Tax=Kordia sp. TaxID=1965332 RepID=UPI00385A9B2E